MKKINIYLWCSQKQIPLYLDYFVKEKGCNWNLITWHKTNPIPACGNKYITDTEYCLFFREKGVRIYGDTSTKGTYFITPLNTSEKNLWNHPTIKPTPFFQKHIIQKNPGRHLIQHHGETYTNYGVPFSVDEDRVGDHTELFWEGIHSEKEIIELIKSNPFLKRQFKM